MSISDFSFSGENCSISIKNKNGSVDDTITGRVTSANISGFTRNVSGEQTVGRYMNNFEGYSPATVELSFVYDVDDNKDNQQMSAYLGSQFTSSGINAVSLKQDKPDYYKIKLEFKEYQAGSFGDFINNDRALRLLFYNSYAVSLNTTTPAEDEVSGTLQFQVLPFNSIGSSNYLELEKTSTDTVSDFNSAETNYDNTMGY